MIDRVRRWLLLAVVVLASTVVGAMAPSTTTVSAASYTYDVPSTTRVEVHEIGASGAGPAQFNAVGEGSAPQSHLARGASTTPTVSLVATNTADDLIGAACRANSFVPGTKVLMADGATKPIEDVRVGDFVYATDPQTGESGPRRVIDVIVGGGKKDLVDVSIDGSIITATGGHPFWVDSEGQWIDADDLAVGDRLLLSDGSTVAIEGLAERGAVQQVHNLTVDGIHTYYVVANDSAVVVHNQGGPCLDAIKIAQHADEAGHVVPGADDLAQYVDDVLKTPGTSITRNRTAWWDPGTGAVVIREADGYGTVFVPDRGYDYYLDLLAE